jgi:transcriptional regulator with XRE-family HTH domain
MQNNESQVAFGRTVSPNPERIRQLRINNGWSAEQFASKARCSYKTIENIEDGRPAYVATLKKLADALKVQLETICCCAAPQEQPSAAAPPPSIPNPPKQQRVAIKVEGPFEDFNECKDLVDFIRTLLRLIRPGQHFDVTGIEPGSVIISLAVSDDDAHRMIAALAEGKLAELYGQVESVTFEDMEVPEIDSAIPIRLYGVNSLSRASQSGLKWETFRKDGRDAQIAAFRSCLAAARGGSDALRTNTIR